MRMIFVPAICGIALVVFTLLHSKPTCLNDDVLSKLNAAGVSYLDCRNYQACPGPCVAPFCDFLCNEIPGTGGPGTNGFRWGTCQTVSYRSFCLSGNPCGLIEVPYCALDEDGVCWSGCFTHNQTTSGCM